MIEANSWPPSLEKLEGHERIRVSVSNIVQTIRVEGSTEEPKYLGFLDPRELNNTGRRRWQALGGAVQLTDLGKRLVQAVGGELLGNQSGKEAGDARFTVPTNKLLRLMPIFSRLRPLLFEDTASREVIEELSTKEFDDYPPVLTADDAKRITCISHGVMQGSPQYQGPAGRFAKDMPFTRMTFLSSITVPKSVLEKMQKSPVLHFFSKQEVNDVFEARLRGEPGRTEGGDPVSDTVMLLSKSPSTVDLSDTTHLYSKETEIEYAVFIALAEAIKSGRQDLSHVLRKLILPSGKSADLSEEQIKRILKAQESNIRKLVLD